MTKWGEGRSTERRAHFGHTNVMTTRIYAKLKPVDAMRKVAKIKKHNLFTSGSVNFGERPTVDGVGVLLSGEAAGAGSQGPAGPTG